ncbi:Glucan 1,3-beta-glucosidase 3 [Phlyctochytrium planicorne]|nr:Glucan 1,3-beta-glucosidase 3 [Phlyctochytrium planicorne]
MISIVWGNDPAQGIDLYQAKDLQDDKHGQSLLIFLHGGAWRTNTRSDPDFQYIGETLSTKHKIHVAIVGYRLSTFDKESGVPKVQHPAHVNDVASGIAWILASVAHELKVGSKEALEANRVLFRANLSKIIIVGHSAGAQLGGLLALKPSLLRRPLEERFEGWGVTDYKKIESLLSLISGYVGCEGIYDIPALVEEYPDYKGFVVQAFGEMEHGKWHDGSPARTTPETGYIKRAHLVLQSAGDDLLTPQQSLIWVKHLKALDIDVEYDETTLVGKHDAIFKEEGFYTRVSAFLNTRK